MTNDVGKNMKKCLNKNILQFLTIFYLLFILLSSAFAEEWWNVDTVNYIIENSKIKYQYGYPGYKMFPTQTSQVAIKSFIIKSVNENQLNKLGTYPGMI